MLKLERNPATKGVYNRNSKGLLTQAATPGAHRGYQTWHRNYDNKFAAWIRKESPFPRQFEDYLRDLYRRGGLSKRFPAGISF